MFWLTCGNAEWRSMKWNQWRQFKMQLAQCAKVFNLVGPTTIKDQSELETVLPLNLKATLSFWLQRAINVTTIWTQTVMPWKLGLWQISWSIIFWKQLNVQTAQCAKWFQTSFEQQHHILWQLCWPVYSHISVDCRIFHHNAILELQRIPNGSTQAPMFHQSAIR